MAAGFVGKVSEKVSFTTKVPMLLKATSDNETPTSGYLYQEINKMTFESVSNCQLLVDFLNDRLKKSSPHIKHKALKIMAYLSANGQSEFRSSLRHHSDAVRQAASFNGSVCSLHGDALNQQVRKAAKGLFELLFNIENPESTQQSFFMAGPTGKKMDGFGNAPLQTTRNTTFINAVKELGSHITTLSGYLQPKASLVSSGYNSHTSSAPLETGNTSSPVKFINYDPVTAGSTDKHMTTNIIRSPIDDDFIVSEKEKNKEDNGTLEGQLVDKITEGGGVRSVPSKHSLDEFAQKCRSLDVGRVLHFLNSKLDEPTLDIQMKSLYAIEHLLQTILPNIADKVLLNCIGLQRLAETETGKLQSKSKKILCTAKSLSSAYNTYRDDNLLSMSELSTGSHKGNSVVNNILDNDLSHETSNQPKQENPDMYMDIFQGLQIWQETKPTENQTLLRNDLDSLNVCEEDNSPSNGIYFSSTAEVFDPLNVGFDSRDTNNRIGSVVTCQVNQNLFQSNTECSKHNASKNSGNDPFNLFSDNIENETRRGNNDFIDAERLVKDEASSPLFTFNEQVDGQTISANQTCLSSNSGVTVQCSVTSQSCFMCEPSLTTQSSLASQSKLTTQFCIASQLSSPSQSIVTTQTNFASQSLGSQSKLANQSSLTSQPCMTSQSSHQAGFGAGNSMLQPLLMPKTGQQSTIPLNLSKPNKKTDFDFLTRSNRETAFSFVQDEMKASKR